ncbi:MAG TPA: peptidyl-prolyl cis-trans isomerase [Candidatus Limnocylindria bacterium]|nr:peptidyl-prolyl cis-trans isomerase [Candidatus Limnocylindria bacterium]
MLVTLLFARNTFAQATAQTTPLRAINGIAAIVNEAIITRQEVNDFIGPSEIVLRRTFSREPEALDQKLGKLREDGTEQLVERQLILSEYKAAGYNYPETIIEDRIQDRIKQRYRDRVTLMQGLREMGITYEAFRKQQRDEILIIAMRQLKTPQDIIISPQKILNYYERHQTNFMVGEEVKLRMIVLNKPPGDTGGVKQLAEEILRKINEGAPFAEMAKIHSDGPYKAASGERGWVQRDSDRKELSDVAFSLKASEHSGVIDLPDSCWLVQVEDRRAARVRPLSEVREQIERVLRIEESARQETKWVKRLREKSFVRYY